VTSTKSPPPRRAPEAFAEWVHAHKPPLRIQFLLAFVIAAALIVLLVRFVDHENPLVEQPVVNSENALKTEQQEGNILARQDQAPHVVKVTGPAAPAAALTSAVKAYMSHQVSRGLIDGPIAHSGCTAAGGSAQRLVFHCTVESASVSYPFDGVVAPGAKTLTYCKVDTAPIAGMKLAISSRCT
jgi:hypothetical protein